MLKNKYFICGLFLMTLYCLLFIYSTVLDYFVMKNPNLYLDCGVRKYNYFDTYDKRSTNFRVGAYTINQCKAGKFLKVKYLALTDYNSGYIYRAVPLDVDEKDMYSPNIENSGLIISIAYLKDPNGKETFFCFYKPIPDVYRENDRETKEEFIERYNKKLAKLDRTECF